jgi:hypothetical protein
VIRDRRVFLKGRGNLRAAGEQQEFRRVFAFRWPRAGLFVPVSKRIHFLEHGSLRSLALRIRGENLANVLLLACCYQEVSMGWVVEVFGDKAEARAREDPTLQRIDWAETVVSQIEQLRQIYRDLGLRTE